MTTPDHFLHTSAYNSIMVWSRASSNKLVEEMEVKGYAAIQFYAQLNG